MRISTRFSAFLARLILLGSVAVLSMRCTAATPPVARAAAGTAVRQPYVGGAQAAAAPDAALQHFQQNIAAYLALRDRATAGLPKPVTSDAATLERTIDNLARAIQTARRRVRRGNVFTADVAVRFRSVISVALRQNGISPADVRADVKEELDEGRTSGQRPIVGINARFAWGAGTAMSPEILAVLPVLPKALEYTFVNRDLLIVDAEADLVIDILPDALQRR